MFALTDVDLDNFTGGISSVHPGYERHVKPDKTIAIHPHFVQKNTLESSSIIKRSRKKDSLPFFTFFSQYAALQELLMHKMGFN